MIIVLGVIFTAFELILCVLGLTVGSALISQRILLGRLGELP